MQKHELVHEFVYIYANKNKFIYTYIYTLTHTHTHTHTHTQYWAQKHELVHEFVRGQPMAARVTADDGALPLHVLARRGKTGSDATLRQVLMVVQCVVAPTHCNNTLQQHTAISLQQNCHKTPSSTLQKHS